MRLANSTCLVGGLLAACLLLGGCGAPVEGQPAQGAATLPARAQAAASGVPTVEALPGVDLSRLGPEQQVQAMKIFQEQRCTCGCNMTVYTCRKRDPNCGRSPVLAADVVRLLDQGKSPREVVQAVFSSAAAPAAAPAAAQPGKTNAPKEMVFPVAPGGSFYTGPDSAPVTLITWLDYQWPYCARVGPTLKQLQETFPDDLKIVYKQHPLPMHYWALVAAEAVLAAGEQGRFLEMDELIFSQQRQIPALLAQKASSMGMSAQEARSEEVQREVFIDLAGQLGLDQGRVRQELEGRVHLAQVKAETEEVMRVGAGGTPASFVNGRFISGARPFQSFRQEVQREIDWARNGNRPRFAQGTSVAQLQRNRRPRGPDPNKVYDLKPGEAPFAGPAGAKVTILHYLDYQWPFCVRVGPTLEQLRREYPDTLRIVYKMHPLPSHPFAQMAAQAALAAQRQGKFLEMHELLLGNARNYNRLAGEKAAELGLPTDQQRSARVQVAIFTDLARQLGLDVARFQADLNDRALQNRIAAETREVVSVGATGTPASFINGKYLRGAQPLASFKALVEQALGRGGGATLSGR